MSSRRVDRALQDLLTDTMRELSRVDRLLDRAVEAGEDVTDVRLELHEFQQKGRPRDPNATRRRPDGAGLFIEAIVMRERPMIV